MRSAWRWTAPLAIGAVLLGAWITPDRAGATPFDISSVVLSNTLPGLVADAPGPTNGPITQANASVLGTSPSQTAAVRQQLADGDLSGYIRVWTRQPRNGDAAAILALTISGPTQVASFLAGFNQGESSVAGSSFSVPGIAGASGYQDHLSESGQPATEYSITFARGDVVYEVELASAGGGLSLNDALSVAARQAAVAPGAVQVPVSAGAPDPMLHVSYVIGEVMFWVVVILLPLGLIQRHRRKKSAALLMSSDASMVYPPPGHVVRSPVDQVGDAPAFRAPQTPGGAPPSGLPPLPALPTFQHALAYSPPPSTPPPAVAPQTRAGWYPDPYDGSLHRYFDGQEWTEHTAPR